MRSHSNESASFAKLWFLNGNSVIFLSISSSEFITSEQICTKTLYEARSQVEARISDIGGVFWGFGNAYVSKCRNITRHRRSMVDSAFESWWSILSDPKKIFVIRTHPEELHVLKSIASTHIFTNFSQQWGQQMLPKCYPTSQGCSCDFQRLKVWPLVVPKPYRTFSNDASSIWFRNAKMLPWTLPRKSPPEKER